MGMSAAMGGYTPPGLVLVGKMTATSGSTASLNNCFTSSYTNYLVLVDNIVASATCGVHLALLSGGSVNAANWVWGQIRPDWAANTFAYNRASSDAQGPQVCIASTSNPSACEVHLFRPFESSWTTITSSGMDARGTNGRVPLITNGQLENTTSYDGLRVETSGQTISSLSVHVYGYRN